MSREARVDEAGCRMREQAEPAEAALALQTPGELVAQRDDLECGRKHELARVQHERFAVGDLDLRREVVLLHGRVDVGVQVVVEHPEETIQPHIDAGRLHERRLERLQGQVFRLDLGDQVSIGEQHRHTVPTWVNPYVRWPSRTHVRYDVAMASWSEFAAADPTLAAAIRALLQQYGP